MRLQALAQLVILIFCLCLSIACHGQIVTGCAYIENNNIPKAREQARREALRSFVEEKIGIHVKAQSETENFLLVRDHITSRSDGFVLVKKVISEKIEDFYLMLTLDLETGDKPFELAEQEVKQHLQSLDRNSSRGSLDIAVFDVDADRTWNWSRYMVACLRKQGFSRIKSNDAVVHYLSNNLNANKLQLYTNLRKVGRESGSTAKAILRGSVRTVNPGTPLANGGFMATAQVALEIIGYESDNIDALTRYVTAVGISKVEAEIRAKENAMEEAAEGLAQQASVTVQYETQGGRREIELACSFLGIANREHDSKIILQALENAQCEIDRSVFASDGSFRVAIYSQSYEKINDLLCRVLEELHRSYPGAYRAENNSFGDSKIILHLR